MILVRWRNFCFNRNGGFLRCTLRRNSVLTVSCSMSLLNRFHNRMRSVSETEVTSLESYRERETEMQINICLSLQNHLLSFNKLKSTRSSDTYHILFNVVRAHPHRRGHCRKRRIKTVLVEHQLTVIASDQWRLSARLPTAVARSCGQRHQSLTIELVHLFRFVPLTHPIYLFRPRKWNAHFHFER